MTNDSLNDITRKDDKEFLVRCLKGIEPEFNANAAADYILDGLVGYGPTEPVSGDLGAEKGSGAQETDYELLCWLVTEADRHEQLYAHHRGDQMAEAFHSVNAQMCRKAAERIDELKSPLPSFFKDILRKLEFSAQQCELWENPEDAGIVAIEYRALAMKLDRWMESHE